MTRRMLKLKIKTSNRGTAMNKSTTECDHHPLTCEVLLQENREFSDTAAVSANNRALGFIPAFKDTLTGNIYRSRFPNGSPAPIHVLAGLPDELVDIDTKSNGQRVIKSSVISGFILEDIFYSREEAVQAAAAVKQIH